MNKFIRVTSLDNEEICFRLSDLLSVNQSDKYCYLILKESDIKTRVIQLKQNIDSFMNFLQNI